MSHSVICEGSIWITLALALISSRQRRPLTLPSVSGCAVCLHQPVKRRLFNSLQAQHTRYRGEAKRRGDKRRGSLGHAQTNSLFPHDKGPLVNSCGAATSSSGEDYRDSQFRVWDGHSCPPQRLLLCFWVCLCLNAGVLVCVSMSVCVCMHLSK